MLNPTSGPERSAHPSAPRNRHTWRAGALAAIGGAVVGLWLGQGAVAADEGAPQIRCRTFETPVGDAIVIDTADATSALGLWVAAASGEGFRVRDVDVDMGTKPNGFPIRHTTVCLQR